MPPKTSLATLSLLALVVGCGRSGVVASDAGSTPDAARPDLGADAPTGRLSFDVVASLAPSTDGGGAPTNLPPTNRFTVVLDTTTRQMIVGGQGTGTVLPVTASGKTYTATGSFQTRTPPLGSCGTTTGITYKTFSFTLSGSTFTGHATGDVQISCGDCFFSVAFKADVAGGPDVTPPTLVSGSAAADPFTNFSLSATEPLPKTATARVVDGDGVGVALDPIHGMDGDQSELVTGFQKPAVVLGAGGGYSVELGGLVDFAGLEGPKGAPLRLGAFTPPPLLAADGFESATGTKVGGAGLVRTGSVSGLPPIAGTQSALVGRSGAPFVAATGATAKLLVRMTAPAGAKKLTYSYRVVGSANGGAFFNGWLSVGSVGKTPATTYGAFTQPKAPTMTTAPDGSPVTLGEVTAGSIELPADLTSEILVEVATFEDSCGGLAPPPSAVLLDDLRVE